MSRIGKKPVPVPAGVAVSVANGVLVVKGPKGELKRTLPSTLTLALENGEATLSRADDSKINTAMHGTMRSHLANMVQGVTEGYLRELEIHGVGFKATVKGKEVVLNLGYSHEINFTPAEGVLITVTDNTQVAVSGIDKEKVGDAAARIRAFAKAEPYKGKGVRYKGEQIRRKVGKAVS